MPGVIAAYPFAATKTVKVLTSPKKKLSEKKLEWAFRKRKDFKVINFIEDTADADDN